MALAGCHLGAHAEQVTATRSPETPIADPRPAAPLSVAALSAAPLSPTARSTVRRGAGRARTDRAELYAVLDAGLVCHLGIVLGDAPVVLPTAYGRGRGDRADTLYLHGSTGAGTLRAAAAGAPVCVTVTHVDGVVYARSVFHFSMNYRSAVVHGRARLVTDHAERLAGLRAVTEHVAPGSWDHARPPTRKELAATAVLALDLARGERQGAHRPARRRRRGRRRRRPVGRGRPGAHRRRRPAALPPAARGHPDATARPVPPTGRRAGARVNYPRRT